MMKCWHEILIATIDILYDLKLQAENGTFAGTERYQSTMIIISRLITLPTAK